MELQCFEIKTEADSDECPHDDKPSTGMFAVSDEQDFVLCTAFALTFFCYLILFLDQIYIVRLLTHLYGVNEHILRHNEQTLKDKKVKKIDKGKKEQNNNVNIT